MAATPKLRISKDLTLPLELVSRTAGILAQKGAGKSNAAVVMAEELYAAGALAVIDALRVIEGEVRAAAQSRLLKEAEETARRAGLVYFARRFEADPVTGLIKIGYTTQLEQRMKALDAVCLHFEPGDRSRERTFHQAFSEHRVRGEWFRPAQPILSYITKAGVD